MKNPVKLVAICIVVTVPRPIHSQIPGTPVPVHSAHMAIASRSALA